MHTIYPGEQPLAVITCGLSGSSRMGISCHFGGIVRWKKMLKKNSFFLVEDDDWISTHLLKFNNSSVRRPPVLLLPHCCNIWRIFILRGSGSTGSASKSGPTSQPPILLALFSKFILPSLRSMFLKNASNSVSNELNLNSRYSSAYWWSLLH